METILRLYFDDDPIRGHITYSHNPANDYSKNEDLKKGTSRDIVYATYEQNYTLLDGNCRFYPSDLWQVHNGYISTAVSNSSGTFANGSSGGTIQVTFDVSQNIDKILIIGSRATNDFSSQVLVKYYQGTQVLQEYTIYPDSVEYEFSNSVENVSKITFDFLKTNKPHRRIRITEMVFGNELIFRGDSIISANIIMETSLLSTELPYGTLSAELYSDTGQFDITNPDSYYAQLHNRMALDVLFNDDNSVRFINRYYLDNWENELDYKIKLKAIDLIGLMGDIQYLGDMYLGNASISEVINRVLSFVPEIKIKAYDPYIPAVPLRGYLKPGTIREAFQQVLFAAGCTAVLQEDNAIYITYERWQNIINDPTWVFTASDIMLNNQSLTIKQPVTKIEINSHAYSYGTAVEKIFEDTLPVGTHTIVYTDPAYVAPSGVTGATLVNSAPAYAIISVTTQGKVTINGQKYIDSIVQHSRNIILSNAKPNIVKITDANLVSPDNVQTIINRMESFYTLKYQQKFRVHNPGFYKPGFVVHADTIYGKKAAITIEQANIDLSNGFVCDIIGTGIILPEDPSGALQKSIIVGGEGTVLPNYFIYPYAGLQTFTVSLKPGYVNLRSINVNINGAITAYYANNATFTLNNPTQFTDVQISFPSLPEKAITVGQGVSATPNKFKYPSNGVQEFLVKNTYNSYYNYRYYIQIKIDGVATQYDILEKIMQLTQTTANTTVEITTVQKNSKTIQREGFNSPFDYYPGVFYYPVIGAQTLSESYWYQSGTNEDGIPIVDRGKADYEWYVDNVLKSKQVQVSVSYFDLYNATSATVVKVKRYNTTGGGGGSGSGGGSGYTTWTGTINSDNSALRSSQWTDSSTLITFMQSGQHVTVTGEVTGSIVFGFPNQSLWYSVTIADGAGAGLSGYVHSGLVNR